jgi:hypothetical protein
MTVASSFPLLRALRGDRPLAFALGGMTLVALLPLFLTPVLPSTDLGAHVALAAQLPRLLAGDALAREHFQLAPVPTPHTLGYLIVALSAPLLGALTAAKLLVGAAVVAVPLAVMRLRLALGRSPWLGLWAFALSWDFNLSVGFVAMNLGTAVALWFVALALEWHDGLARGRARLAGLLGVGVLVALAHGQAALTVLTVLGVMALVDRLAGRRVRWLAALSLWPALVLVPYVWSVVASAGPYPTAGAPLDFPNLGQRVEQLFLSTLDLVTPQLGRNVEGLTFLFVALLPLLYGIGGGGERAGLRRALAFYAGAFALFLALPETMHWPAPHVLIHQRYGALVLVAGLLVPELPAGRSRPLLLAPGVVAALSMAAVVSWQAHSFAREVRGLPAVLEAVRPQSRVHWVVWQNGTPDSVRFTLTTSLAYVTAERGGYAPHLFPGAALPVSLRSNAQLPFAPWNAPEAFHPVTHGKHYDYVLVLGLRPPQPGTAPSPESAGREPAPPERLLASRSLEIALTEHSGPFSVYEVRVRGPSPPAARH